MIDRVELPPLISIGLLLILSFAGGQIANIFGAPRVIGYLVVGILIGSILPESFYQYIFKIDSELVSHMALAIISFSIGGSLELSKIRRLGNQILWITFSQAFGAFIFSTIILGLFLIIFYCSGDFFRCFMQTYFPMALVVGAICAATAPAATLAIVHEYRAKGPFTTILLGVVALDDGLTIFLYAFAVNIAHSFVSNDVVTFYKALIFPSLSVIVSLIIGGAVGILTSLIVKYVHSKEILLGVILGSIFLTSGLADTLHGHSLMANMMLGFMIINYVKHHHDIFDVIEGIEEPVFGMFFTLAGTHFDVRIIKSAGIISLVIVLGRFMGKLIGSRFGAKISESPNTVKNYLGFALLPTAGVTIGLVFDAQNYLSIASFSEMMVTGVLGSVIINEFMTPFFLKASLNKVGETQVKTTGK
jgi:Kef-type K+ transport system membrane component KefB